MYKTTILRQIHIFLNGPTILLGSPIHWKGWTQRTTWNQDLLGSQEAKDFTLDTQHRYTQEAVRKLRV